MKLRHALVIKRYLAAYQNVENNTETPDIDFGPGVLSCLEQLWSSKIKTTTEGFQETSGREEVAETKVDDFDITRLADQDVLDFQITVNDAVAMTVIQSAGDLASKFAGLLLL